MAKRYKMPSTTAPIVDTKTGTILPVWLGVLREFMVGLEAERAPGLICLFALTAADLLDAEKFAQGGATDGLGVGEYLGWAQCNGSNGTIVIASPFADTAFLMRV